MAFIISKAAFLSALLCACASTALAQEPTLGAGGRPIDADWSRSPVYAEHGIAATAHPLASQIAIDILKKGGSAADAAIAVNAALGLMEPTGCGLGGDLFAIVWDPKTEKLYGLNASGRAPMGRTLEETKAKAAAIMGEGKGIPPLGHLPASVPGAASGWFALHEKFGKLPMRTILEPAIGYAENGFPVSPVIAFYMQYNLARFEELEPMIDEFDNARAIWFTDGPPKAGEIFKNPDLAETYRLLAKKGRKAFYEGEIAQTIDAYMKRIGGDLRYEDFAAHEAEWVEPGCVDYKGYDVCELPPNGQGFAALQMLNILKNVDLTQWPRASAEVFHYMVEAKRLAFEDLAKFYADPAFVDVPIDWLLSDEYGAERFALIDPKKAMTDPAPGTPPASIDGEGDTTYFTVADKDGMMVSLIQSNYRGMGSGLAPDGLGFMLQDRGELFSLDPDHPNAYAPGKRPFHTIIPAFVMKDGKPFMSFGLMGGGMQPQGHVQVLVNMIDYGMNVQEAGDAARFHHSGGRTSAGPDGDPLGQIDIEPGVPAETVAKLKAMGHKVNMVDNGLVFGGYQAIIRDPETGVYSGATEMRKDGTVAGY
ncbi:gamma-glutamyltransferase [Hyphococcus sp.]|jgi:gamma-glutamyltranspeptidase/glutathione hydrolase|uniref:gamma-glutamyltransferase n=1 Tax=Hyphococcus sp. TaxID=2038636 RepID=UPI003D10578E